jgi:hypothetical protein
MDDLFSSLSGDHVEHMILYIDRRPTRWELIKHHFLHFGEEWMAPIIGVWPK